MELPARLRGVRLGAGAVALIDYITKNVAIGSLTDAEKEDDLLRRGITRVVNLCEMPSRYISLRADEIALPSGGRPEPERLHKVADKIDELVKEGERVLVHCLEGIDRSPTAVMVYLKDKQGLSTQQAVAKVRAHRPQSDPHANWLNPLTEAEKQQAYFMGDWAGGGVAGHVAGVRDLYPYYEYEEDLLFLPVEELTPDERELVLDYLHEIPPHELLPEDAHKMKALEDIAREEARGWHYYRPPRAPRKAVTESELEKGVKTGLDALFDKTKSEKKPKTRAELYREEKEAEQLADLEYKARQRWKELRDRGQV